MTACVEFVFYTGKDRCRIHPCIFADGQKQLCSNRAGVPCLSRPHGKSCVFTVPLLSPLLRAFLLVPLVPSLLDLRPGLDVSYSAGGMSAWVCLLLLHHARRAGSREWAEWAGLAATQIGYTAPWGGSLLHDSGYMECPSSSSCPDANSKGAKNRAILSTPK